jgi:hypothetical protein
MLILVEQKRMLEESERMIVDTDKRLGDAVQELRNLIVCPASSPLILSLPSRHSAAFFPFLTSLQIRSKADPALAEAEELLNAEEEMEAAAI